MKIIGLRTGIVTLMFFSYKNPLAFTIMAISLADIAFSHMKMTSLSIFFIRSSFVYCVLYRKKKSAKISLLNRVEKMLKKKETEVWNEVLITLDELYRENRL